jgi:hypothetical protein
MDILAKQLNWKRAENQAKIVKHLNHEINPVKKAIYKLELIDMAIKDLSDCGLLQLVYKTTDGIFRKPDLPACYIGQWWYNPDDDKIYTGYKQTDVALNDYNADMLNTMWEFKGKDGIRIKVQFTLLKMENAHDSFKYILYRDINTNGYITKSHDFSFDFHDPALSSIIII